MARNRQAFIDEVLSGIEKIIPNSPNVELYKQFFASMNDSEFHKFVQELKEGKRGLPITVPNGAKYKLDVKRNLKIAKEWGHEFFQRIWMSQGPGLPKYLTPNKYLVVKLPLKRQAQHMEEKISVQSTIYKIDNLTGQPIRSIKSSKISYPEVQMMTARNLDKSLNEFLRYRGGDVKGFNALNTSISRTGTVSQSEISRLGTQAKSTVALSILLTGMHLENQGLRK